MITKKHCMWTINKYDVMLCHMVHCTQQDIHTAQSPECKAPVEPLWAISQMWPLAHSSLIFTNKLIRLMPYLFFADNTFHHKKIKPILRHCSNYLCMRNRPLNLSLNSISKLKELGWALRKNLSNTEGGWMTSQLCNNFQASQAEHGSDDIELRIF